MRGGKYFRNNHNTTVGSYNAICQRCGLKFPIEQIKKEEQTNLWVCDETANGCYEERHPQEFVYNIPELMYVSPCLPDPDGQFECYSDAICDIAIADCTTCDMWATPPVDAIK